MSLWKQADKFPISFKQVPGLQSLDETEIFMNSLDKMTPLINEIFKEVSTMSSTEKSPRALQKELLEFFVGLGPQGFLVCLGVRKT